MPPRRRGLTHDEIKSVGVSEYLGADVPCGDCETQLQDFVCSHCEQYVCRSCVWTHTCPEMRVDDRMRIDPHLWAVLQQDEEDPEE